MNEIIITSARFITVSTIPEFLKIRPLNERLWNEGNTSIAYGPRAGEEDGDLFSLTLFPEEMSEALDIPLKDVREAKVASDTAGKFSAILDKVISFPTPSTCSPTPRRPYPLWLQAGFKRRRHKSKLQKPQKLLRLNRNNKKRRSIKRAAFMVVLRLIYAFLPRVLRGRPAAKSALFHEPKRHSKVLTLGIVLSLFTSFLLGVLPSLAAFSLRESIKSSSE